MHDLSRGPSENGSIPLITVAMPVYNAGGDLRGAVLSIIKQTYQNWELLIIDDGSTDNAFDLIQDIKDSRVHILRDGVNKGLAARLNEAINLAKGQYFARMDQDDMSYPKRFDVQIEALESDKQLDLVGLKAITISGDNELTGLLPTASTRDTISSMPWRGFYLPHPTWMGRIDWFRKHQYANPGPYFCEDQELLLRSYEVSKFSIILEPLFAYRLRSSINFHKLAKTRQTLLKVQIKHFLKKRLYFFILMSVLMFLGRTSIDLLKRISNLSYPLVKSNDKKLVTRWREVLSEIQKDDS